MLRRTLPGTLLVFLHAWVLLWWISADQRSASGLYPEHIWPLVDAIQASLPYCPAATPAQGWVETPGLLPWLGALAHGLGQGNSDSPLYLVAAMALLAQALTGSLARRLGGDWSALAAMAIFPLVPAIALVERHWGVLGPGLLLLPGAGLLALSSKGFTRPGPSLGFLLVALLGAAFSSRLTFNILILLALAGWAAGCVMGPLLRGRHLDGSPANRWRVLAGATTLAICVGVAATSWYWATGTWDRALDYYTAEVSLRGLPYPWWHPRALLAYPLHMFWRGLTPWLAIPLLPLLVAWLLCGKARLELLFALGLPLSTLSLLAKKNYYYPWFLLPLLPLLAGMGFQAMRSQGRATRWPAALWLALIVCVGSLQLAQRTLPWVFAGTEVGRLQWQGADSHMGGTMQDSDGDMVLAPFPGDCLTRHLPSLIRQALSGGYCERGCTLAILKEGDLRVDIPELALRLAGEEPCLALTDGASRNTDVLMWLARNGPDGHDSHGAASLVGPHPFSTIRRSDVCGVSVELALRGGD